MRDRAEAAVAALEWVERIVEAAVCEWLCFLRRYCQTSQDNHLRIDIDYSMWQTRPGANTSNRHAAALQLAEELFTAQRQLRTFSLKAGTL
jgi:hypothetical protein